MKFVFLIFLISFSSFSESKLDAMLERAKKIKALQDESGVSGSSSNDLGPILFKLDKLEKQFQSGSAYLSSKTQLFLGGVAVLLVVYVIGNGFVANYRLNRVN